MKQITKITVKNGKINILHSDTVLDKRNSYEIQFNSFYLGYVDYYVSKSKINKVQKAHLESCLYVSTQKFKNNKQFYIELVVASFREEYSKFNWYREPELPESKEEL